MTENIVNILPATGKQPATMLVVLRNANGIELPLHIELQGSGRKPSNPYTRGLQRSADMVQALAGHVPAQLPEYASRKEQTGSKSITDIAYTTGYFDSTLALKCAVRQLARTSNATGTDGSVALRRTSAHHIARSLYHDAADIAADAYLLYNRTDKKGKTTAQKLLAYATGKGIPAERLTNYITGAVVSMQVRKHLERERYRKVASIGNLELQERMGSIREHTLTIPDTHSKAGLLRAVANLLARGERKASVAKQLGISKRTVFYAIATLRQYIEVYHSHTSTIPHKLPSKARLDLYGSPTLATVPVVNVPVVNVPVSDLAQSMDYLAAQTDYQWDGSGI